jgi:hypothetical protein
MGREFIIGLVFAGFVAFGRIFFVVERIIVVILLLVEQQQRVEIVICVKQLWQQWFERILFFVEQQQLKQFEQRGVPDGTLLYMLQYVSARCEQAA